MHLAAKNRITAAQASPGRRSWSGVAGRSLVAAVLGFTAVHAWADSPSVPMGAGGAVVLEGEDHVEIYGSPADVQAIVEVTRTLREGGEGNRPVVVTIAWRA